MFGRRACIFTLLVLVCLVFVTPTVTVYAAPPANDDIANATVIPSLPFSEQLDVTEATWDDFGPVAYVCPMGPGYDLGTNVWYKYTPSMTHYVGITIPTGGGSYWRQGMYRGEPGSLQIIGCDDDRYWVEAGQTYYLMVAGGETLNLIVEDLGPPFYVELAVDPRGVANPRTGAATIAGQVSSPRPTDVWVHGELRQKLGRKTIITGYFEVVVHCDGQATWSAVVRSNQGAYGGGSAEVLVTASGCDWSGCDESQVAAMVSLIAGRR
jgi:hypothetical protein